MPSPPPHRDAVAGPRPGTPIGNFRCAPLWSLRASTCGTTAQGLCPGLAVAGLAVVDGALIMTELRVLRAARSE
eukprot:6973746-Alexandrium_andersonii.AAC.1